MEKHSWFEETLIEECRYANSDLGKLLGAIWHMLGVEEESMYDVIKFYYCKGLYKGEEEPQLIAITHDGGIVKATVSCDFEGFGDLDVKGAHVEVLLGKDIRKLSFRSSLRGVRGPVELDVLDSSHESFMSLKSLQDSNGRNERAFAERIMAITRFLMKKSEENC